MKICIITDEISADPESAIEIGTEWGIHDFEFRGYFTDRVPRLSGYQKQRLRDSLEDYQARLVAIAPGLFKIPFPPAQASRATLGWLDRDGYDRWANANQWLHVHLNELLPESLDFANEFGAGLVVIFGFDRAGRPPGDPPDELLNCLRLACERAQAAGLQLVLENEDGFWADTGARTARMIRSVNHPALGLNWDPGNAFFADDVPYPAGYASVHDLVKHVHFKDAWRDPSGEPHYTSEGQIDWAGQIEALITDGYDGYVSIETHLRPKVAVARASLARLRMLMAGAGVLSPETE